MGDDPEARANEYIDSMFERTTRTWSPTCSSISRGDTSSSVELVLDLILDGFVRLDAKR